MDQVVEDRAPWLKPFRFAKGESRHSRRRAKIVAEREALTSQFVATHGRDPLASEARLLNEAAMLAVDLQRAEIKVIERKQIANTLTRLHARLGFYTEPRKLSAPAEAPYKSGRELIERMKSEAKT